MQLKQSMRKYGQSIVNFMQIINIPYSSNTIDKLQFDGYNMVYLYSAW